VQNSGGKFLASIFWDQDGILLIDCLPKGQTINVEYYTSLLVQLKDTLKERCRGKVTKGVLFLHDSAPTHWALATQKKLACLGFQCLDHPPYSLDLAPLDYHLFPGLKKQLKGCHFSSNAEVIAAAETWLDGQPSEFFLSGLQKLEEWAKKCTELRREYVEQIPSLVTVASFLPCRAKDLSAPPYRKECYIIMKLFFFYVLLVSNLYPFRKFSQEQRQHLTCRILLEVESDGQQMHITG